MEKVYVADSSECLLLDVGSDLNCQLTLIANTLGKPGPDFVALAHDKAKDYLQQR